MDCRKNSDRLYHSRTMCRKGLAPSGKKTNLQRIEKKTMQLAMQNSRINHQSKCILNKTTFESIANKYTRDLG